MKTPSVEDVEFDYQRDDRRRAIKQALIEELKKKPGPQLASVLAGRLGLGAQAVTIAARAAQNTFVIKGGYTKEIARRRTRSIVYIDLHPHIRAQQEADRRMQR